MKQHREISLRALAGPAVVVLAASVTVVPQLMRGNSCGHDFDFHLVSWLDCLNGWRHGIIYPHWAASANFGAGEPRFVFYPPLTWMLGAALGLMLPWKVVPIALTFLLLAGTGLATRALAREALDDGAATLAGCAALFSGYSLFTAYERTAFGELAGGFWIPLLLLFALRDRNQRSGFWRRTFDSSTAALAVVMAGCWLSNLPVGVMGCYLLAAVAVVAAALRRSWATVLRASVGVALGTALAALYLLPAVWEQRWVDVRQALYDPGLLIENSWLFARHANPTMVDHDIELHKVSVIAVSMLAVTLTGLAVRRLRGKLVEDRTASRSWWITLALIPVVVLFLLVPVSLPVWNLLPKLRFLQFPWRWLVVLEAPMAIFFAGAVWPRKTWMREAVVAICAILFVGATLHAGRTFFQPCDDEDSVAGIVGSFHSGAGFTGYDEYAPPGADNGMIASGLPDACLVSDPAIELGTTANRSDADDAIPIWKVTQGSCDTTLAWRVDEPEHRVLIGAMSHAGFLILRLRSYPNWRVVMNGQPVSSMPQRSDGLMAISVPQGSIDLTADWATTPDVIASRWSSIVAVLILVGLWAIERKLKLPRL
ncbi:MAG: 6-pyruvoyl-tetrahydropterin synthase-related protein [Terracidiphilus sp.]|jgi:hypothetical protein